MPIAVPEPVAPPYPVFCPGAHADGTPTAGYVFVKTLAADDQQALRELLADVPGWAERVQLILDEVACDERGRPPTQEQVDAFFPLLSAATLDRLHRAACAANGLPHLPVPTHYLPPPTRVATANERRPKAKRR